MMKCALFATSAVVFRERVPVAASQAPALPSKRDASGEVATGRVSGASSRLVPVKPDIVRVEPAGSRA